MLSFPIHNTALDLKGKLPSALPHGLLPIPLAAREIVAKRYAQFSPEAFAPYAAEKLCWETVCWYYQGLVQEVIYRVTPEGPEVLAVGVDEALALMRRTTPDEQLKFKTYQD